MFKLVITLSEPIEIARTGLEIRCVDGSDLEEVKEMMHTIAEYIKEGTDVIFE